MPEISRFFGIVIAMYYRDHAPPHFHARHGDREIRVAIESGAILSGRLAAGAQRLVLAWCELHREELLSDWTRAAERKPLLPIRPLE